MALDANQVKSAVNTQTLFLTQAYGNVTKELTYQLGMKLLAVFANDAEVTFGLNELERQMRDFETVMDNAQHHGWTELAVNLFALAVTFPEATDETHKCRGKDVAGHSYRG